MAGVPADLKDALADRYQIRRLIGSGGMASVYAATDLRHQRQVACKVLDRELAAAIGPRRFLSEIRIAANLQHPHILPVFDSGEAGGWLYYVMPLIAGGTLRERLERDGALRPSAALRLAREVADGLTSAHGAGIVHRDIKPANILMSQDHALLADFGIARREVSEQGVSVTGTGVVLGTPTYMSPEQVAGDTVDARSDVYSLGCVLYEMLAGRPPFVSGTSAALAAAHLAQPPPTLSSLGIEVHASVERLVARSLEKDPADRFATMGSLLAAVEDALLEAVGARTASTRRGATANLGPLVSKLCNRWRQVNAFEAALRSAVEELPHLPQVYVIHGEEGNGHSSLLERLLHTRVAEFARSLGPSETSSVLRLSVPWPRGPDPAVLERHLRIALFRELEPSYMGGDLSAERLAAICAGREASVVVVDHDIRARSWNHATESLLRWCLERFWGSLTDGTDRPRFLVFINVVYEAAGPELAWTRRLVLGRRQRRIRSRMEHTLAGIGTSHPLTVLDELQPVTLEDVKDWFARNRIYESEQLRSELAESIFAGVTEKPMAAVEAALAEIHAAFSADRIHSTGFAR